MSGLDTLRTRLQFAGGKAQVGRMNESKLNSLKRALLYSYQSATAILQDGREFRCLINPDKLKTRYDEKIISIPFFDIQLNPELKESKKFQKTSKGEEEIARLRLERDIAESLYESAQEAINVQKLKIRVLENQLSREWGAVK